MKISNRIVRFALVSTTATFMTMVGALATTPVVATASSVSMVMDAELAVESQAGSAALNLAPLDADGRRLYVVRLHEPSLATYEGGIRNLAPTSPRATGASRLDVRAPASQAYLDHLSGRHADVLQALAAEVGRNVEPAFTYLNVLNAMAVNLTPAEARRVAGLPGVRSVNPDRIMELETDVGPALIGAPALWDGVNLPGLETRGEGVVVGIIDTGINSQHPAFAETDMDGYTHTNPYGSGNFVGWCDTDDPTFCNDKLIGAWSFNPVGGNPEDDHNHGSHVGSTAAGNRHVAAYELGGQTFNLELSGVAPRANVIGYKVCSPGCPNTASVAAVNQGIADGVDILNYSISGSDNPWNDIVDQAFLDAFAANVFVAASAGNDGPGPSTVAKTGPWNAAVAASTHSRIFANILNLTGGPQDVAAVPGTGPDITATYVGDLRWAGDVDAGNAEGCNAFPANSFDGEAALISRGGCTFATKVNNAVAAGADFVVAYNHVGGPPIAMGGLEPTTVPAVMVDNVAGADLIAALGGGTAEVEVEVNVDLFDEAAYADVMGGFSSRGPSQFDLMAPTFSAPGVNILAAGRSVGGDPDQWYQSQGTSMSSPHAAGAAALVRGLHPGWSPAEIRSAMSLSADPDVLIKEDGLTPADPFDQGSGRLDLSAAGRLTLVMDETTANFEAADPATGGDPRTLNVPHLVDQNCSGGSCSWTRTVTSVADEAITYEASADAPAGMTVTVDPATFSIDSGESQTLEITVDVDFGVLPAGDWAFAGILLEPQENGSVTSAQGRSLSGSFVAFDPSAGGDAAYEPGVAQTLCFDAESSTDDWEYAESVWLRFPGSWEVTDVNVVGTPSCQEGGTFGTFDWEFVDAPFELRIDHERQHNNPTDTCNVHYCVDLTSDAAGDPASVSWYWAGDVWGSPPHNPCSDDGYTPDGQPACDESVAAPAAIPLAEPLMPATARMPIAIIPLDDTPEIGVDPDSIHEVAEEGDIATSELLIQNFGDAELNFDIEFFSAAGSQGRGALTVIWEQPQQGTGGIISDFFLGTPAGDVGVYSANDFEINAAQNVQEIFIPGFWNGGNIDTAVALDWAIYADDSGVPAGIPNDGGTAPPVWSYTAAPGDPGVTIADNNVTLNLDVAGEPAINLPDGTYWLVFYPTINFGADFNDRWNWSQGEPALDTSHLVDPDDLFGAGATQWTPQTAIGVAWPDTAFTLSGTIDCEATPPGWLSLDVTSGSVPAQDSQTVNLTMDSDGLALGTYEADLCISSNDPDNPLLFVPVSFEVAAAGSLPQAEVTPSSFAFSLAAGDTADDTLDVANVAAAGADDLVWSIATDEQIASLGSRFEGDFDISNWTFENNPPGVNGSFNINPGPPVELFLIGGDDGTPGDADLWIEIPNDGTITFDWGYQSTDTGDWDSGGYVVNGAYTQLADNASQVPFFNESATVEVNAGDLFAFRVNTVDGTSGAGELGVTNFEFAPDLCDPADGASWLTATPDSGSTAAETSDAVTVDVDTAGLGAGQYQGALCVTTNDPNAELVVVPVSLEVSDPTLGTLQGMVTSLGYCSDDPDVLEGADVTVTGDSGAIFSTTTDASGFYSLQISESESPVDVLIEHADHQSGSESGVVIEAGATATVDFDLVLDASCATVDPEVMEATVSEDGSATLALEVGNVDGAGELNWTLFTAEAESVAPRAHFPSRPYRAEPASRDGISWLADEAVGDSTGISTGLPLGVAVPAYSTTGFTADGYIGMDALVPESLTIINPAQPTTFFAGTFIANDLSQHYSLASDGGASPFNSFGPIDIATGEFTSEGLVTGAGTGTWTSMAWDHSTGTLFAVQVPGGGTNNLYTIDVDTLEATLVGEITGGTVDPGAIVIAIAISPDGLMYGVDIVGNVLLAIDKTDAEAAAIGPLGVDANFAQDMDFDQTDGTLYWAGYLGGGNSQIFVIDTDTGAATSLGNVEDGNELLNFSIALPGSAVCGTPASIPWLSVNPDTGTTAAGGTSMVDVLFDADGLSEGTYEAVLCLSSNDPVNSIIEIPVTMTVVDQDPAELAVSPTELAFGEVDLGDDATQSFTVSNAAASGAMSLELSALDLSGDGEFAITGGDCAVGTELDPGEDCSVEVTFTPSAVDTFSGQVDIATVDGQSDTVTLSGEGAADPAELGVSPTELDFGEVALGQSSAMSVTVSNVAEAGAMNLELSALDLTGDAEFSVTGGDCAVGSELEPGESCTVEVSFEPVDEVASSGSLSVETADGQSQAVALDGEGVELPADIFQDRFEEL